MKTTKRDTYAVVTASIIAALEAGTAPWVRPWRNTEGMDRNGESGRPYNGINVLLTMWSSLMNGFNSNEWFTFNQVRKKGGHVKKGSRSTLLVFFKPMEIRVEDEVTGEWKKKKIPLLREFNVFNRDQCEGLPERMPVEALPEPDRNEIVDEWIAALGSKIVSHRRSDRACYSPFLDRIEMPPMKTFDSSEAYYATLFHEHAHWTGHESRLDRDLKNGFGTPEYAYEELIAELASAFLCAEFQVDGKLQHPEYIASWIKRLKDDKKLIFSAASKARTAVAYLNGDMGEDAIEEEEAA